MLVPGLLSLFEFYGGDCDDVTKYASQTFMLRFDKAHDHVKDNPRILDILAFGTPEYRRKDRFRIPPTAQSVSEFAEAKS